MSPALNWRLRHSCMKIFIVYQANIIGESRYSAQRALRVGWPGSTRFRRPSRLVGRKLYNDLNLNSKGSPVRIPTGLKAFWLTLYVIKTSVRILGHHLQISYGHLFMITLLSLSSLRSYVRIGNDILHFTNPKPQHHHLGSSSPVPSSGFIYFAHYLPAYSRSITRSLAEIIPARLHACTFI